jgi:hypothetical protein
MVFVPFLLLVVFFVLRYRQQVFKNHLAWVAIGVIALHLIIIAGFTPWNGGFCYGPRYTTGVVPWFALLGMFASQPIATSVHETRFYWAVGLLLFISVFVNARGATAYETWMWNVWPENVDRVPQKIWDWRRPQFLAGLVAPPLPEPLPLLRDRVKLGSNESDRLIWYGWSWGEKDFRWTDGKEAALAFAVEDPRNKLLSIRIGAFVVKDKLTEQNVRLFLNGSRLQDLVLNEEPAKEYTFELDGNLLRERNKLVFILPDAASPKSLGISEDQRRLGIRLESIELRPLS